MRDPSRPVRLRGASPQSQVIDPERLKEGGTLLIVPFAPGVGVPAIDEVDTLALMIVKGIIETLESEKAPFTIVPPEQASQARFLIRGHITAVQEPRGLRRWFGAKKSTLSADGQLVDVKTGNLVLILSHTAMYRETQDQPGNVAYEIGCHMGRFIAAASGQ